MLEHEIEPTIASRQQVRLRGFTADPELASVRCRVRLATAVESTRLAQAEHLVVRRHRLDRAVAAGARGGRRPFAAIARGGGTIDFVAATDVLDGASLLLVIAETLRAAGIADLPDRTDCKPELTFHQYAQWQQEVLQLADEHDVARRAASSRSGASRLAIEQDASDGEIALSCTVLSAELRRRISECAAAARRSEEAFALAAWQLVLQQAAQQQPVRMAVMHPGRPLAEFANCIGPLAWAGDAILHGGDQLRFSEAWRDAQAGLDEARQIDVPSLSALSDAPRPFGFSFLAPPTALNGAAAAIEMLSAPAEPWPLSLTVLWAATPILTLSHDSARIGKAEAALLLERLVAALGRACQEPDVLASDVLGVGAAEQQLLQVRGPDTTPEWAYWDERVVAYGLTRSQQTAVICDEARLTYAELESNSRAVAAALTADGLGRGDLIGHWFDRSIEAVVAMIAILRAGAAYVPIDPEMPPARSKALLQQAGVKLLLGSDRLIEPLAGTVATLPVASWPDLPAPENWRAPQRHPADLAYVLFTSGTTGKPKPVGIEHRQLANYVASATSELKLDACRSFATVSTLAADLGNTMVMGALALGATLHVVTRDRMLDPDALADYLERWQVDCLKLVPSHLKALLERHRRPPLPRRLVICGGEQLDWAVVEQVHSLAPACQIANHYGPTEATVGVLTNLLPATRGRESSVPLGRPLANVQIYLLDERLRPVPLGCIGEIYVGGDNVTRGYLGQPKATAEAFLPDPFSLASGRRMYRTGDQASLSVGGALVFVRRREDDSKVRGHRVDPAEVAAMLRTMPQVADALVYPKRTAAGDVALVAYLRPSTTLDFEATQIAEWGQVFDSTHAELETKDRLPLDPFGWNSSYTGEPLPEQAIREQVEAVVERLRRHAPRLVLELGCGTGLILNALAPHCEEYWGLDMSRSMLKATASGLAKNGGDATKVKLLHRAAHEIDDLPPRCFDLVIMNSIVQYFPSVRYLEEVLANIMPKLAPGGRIFIGDVRNLRLQRALHASVALYRVKPNSSVVRLRDQMLRREARDSELVLDPSWFHALGRSVKGIQQVEVTLKRGSHNNELTKFRYDVLLHTQCDAPIALKWQDSRLTALDRLLEQARTAPVGVRGLLNARIATDVALARILAEPGSMPTRLEDIGRQIEATATPREAVDPEELHRVASRNGCAVRLFWSDYEDDRFDAAFLPASAAHLAVQPAQLAAPPAVPASFPLQGMFTQKLVPAIRAMLGSRLPEYMVPARFVIVETFPLSSNGKVDPAALPEPVFGLGSGEPTNVRPRTPTELVVADIWSEILQLDAIGNEEFFELGGHSLLATQAIVRLRELFEIDLPLRVFFDTKPTVEAVARAIERHFASPAAAAAKAKACLDAGSAPKSARSPVAEVAPAALSVSFAEERLLLEPDPTHPAYNIPFAFRLDGEIDIDGMQFAFDQIARRHDVWRTGFATDRGEWVRTVHAVAPMAIERIDLRMLPAAARIAEATRVANQRAQDRFDLARAPLARVALLQLDTYHHAMVVVVHHVISDGWSTALFCSEFSSLYAGWLRGVRQPSNIAAAYSQMALSQRRRYDDATVESMLDAWQARLGPDLPELVLPVDKPYPARQTYRGTGLDVALSQHLSAAAAGLARRENCTLFMVLVAIYSLMVSRSSRPGTVVVGTPIANRQTVRQEQSLGCFINFIVLGFDLTGDPSFSGFLAMVRETCVWAFEHQDAPFARLVDRYGLARGARRPPLFQVMFELANAPGESLLDLPGLTLRALPFDHGTSEFEINLILRETPTGLAGWMLYRTDLFQRATVERLFRWYESALAAVVENPDIRVSQLPPCVP